MSERYYTLKEIAEFVNVDLSTAKRWRKDGKLPEPAVESGEVLGWTQEDITAIIQWRTNRGKYKNARDARSSLS